MTTELQELFSNNQRWARDTEERSPGFFTKLLKDLCFTVSGLEEMGRVYDQALLALRRRYAQEPVTP